MPAKNAVKIYSDNGYYHIYNRGVEKRLIFLDDQDYAVFISYLKTYLLPRDEKKLSQALSDPNASYKEKNKILKELRLKNFSEEITLLAYCLMPNHIHFLIKQKSPQSMNKFMSSLLIRYGMFFNRKYKRPGSLFQGVYKAALIETEDQLLYLTSYIHRNPLKQKPRKLGTQVEYLRGCLSQPSSLPEYLGTRKTEWIKPEEILAFFSKINPKLSYQSFVEQTDDMTPIQKIILDI